MTVDAHVFLAQRNTEPSTVEPSTVEPSTVEPSRVSTNLPKIHRLPPGKVFQWAAKALNIIVVLGMILLFPVTIAAAYLYKAYNHSTFKSTIENLAIKRFQVMQNALVLPKLPSELDKFHRRLEKINTLLQTPPKDHVHDHMQKVREEIDLALQTPYYESNKENREDPFIQYIHLAAHTLTTRAAGMSQMEAFGEKFRLEEANPSFETLVETLDKAVYDYSGFQRDNLIGTTFWAIAHPQKAWASFRGHGKKTALAYNSYKEGNANMHVASFSVGNMKMHLNLGPTPTSDRLFEAHLQYLENQNRDQIHFQHDLEFPGIKGEDQRRLKKKEMADRHEENFTYISTPLDGEIWKGEGQFAEMGSVFSFHSSLLNYAGESRDEMPINSKKDNGFYLPTSVLSDEKFMDTVFRSAEAFKKLEESPYWTALALNGPEGLRRLKKAMLLGFEGMVAIRTILTLAKKYAGRLDEVETFMGQACKQDIDRGVLLNVVTMLYMDALAETPLTQERINQLVGMVLVRSGMVDDRVILGDRFEALSDLLHLISYAPKEFMGEVKKLNDSVAVRATEIPQ